MVYRKRKWIALATLPAFVTDYAALPPIAGDLVLPFVYLQLATKKPFLLWNKISALALAYRS